MSIKYLKPTSMKFFIYIIFITFCISSCNSRTCTPLPENFPSYEKAKETILNSTYSPIDSFSSSSNTIINTARFLSCDKKEGYIFFRSYRQDSETFVSHVPISIWEKFKNASNQDSFFSKEIDNKYTSVGIEVEINTIK